MAVTIGHYRIGLAVVTICGLILGPVLLQQLPETEKQQVSKGCYK